MIGVIVKKDDIIVEKRFLAGDDKKNLEMTIYEQSVNLDKEYIVYPENEKTDFDLQQVPISKTSNQKDWDALKDKATDAEKLFAKVLGLG